MNRWALVLLAILLVSLNSGCSGLVTGSTNAAAVAPSITAQPTGQTVTAGQTATFSVAATGTAPMTYQWKKNGAAISVANSSSYTTPSTSNSDNGAQFSVVVSNSTGSATSSSATLTVDAAAIAPSITTQPASQTVTAGQTATFSVTATGTAPLTYQWKKNSVSISGANLSSYTTPSTSNSDSGAQFFVMVSNSAGNARSSSAMLTVNVAATPLQVSTAQLPGGFVAGGYSSTLAATGGSTPYSWSLLSGSLPNGLTLNAGGVISGTPSLAGSFSFTVQVKDASSTTASRNFSINIASPVPTVAITSPTSGSTVSGTISVSGTASDSVAISSVQVAIDGGSYSPASGTNNWSFSLNTASLSNGSHSLSAKTTDAAGISATSSAAAITVNNGSTASNCTLFASPSGNDSNSGSTSSSPKTFNGAAAASQPGSVVCLLGGTY
ncbi:MAG TPA: immunoglobulin domain-containing protein, partial [Candidatus Angelobacter sp.]|nr:immunoglobulin domain-containing protein [Candidatus Angelobacter sp.]